MELFVVTGLSGAGKSTCLDALEDMGFYCVDNVPVPLLPQLVDLLEVSDAERRVGIGLDAREADYLDAFPEVYEALIEAEHKVEVLFLEAPNEVLVRRYSETRRKHPMGELPEAIVRERDLLTPVRARASVVLDTSGFTGRQLRQLVRDRYGALGRALSLVLMSFGFRGGVPPEADVVLDARFLANPYDVPTLRPLSGLHDPVSRYVLEQEDAGEFLGHAERLLRFMVPRSAREGRSYLTVAIGCTGGQHRSVSLVEALKNRIDAGEPLCDMQLNVLVRHRDIGKV